MENNNFELIKTTDNIPNITNEIDSFDVYVFKYNDKTIGYSLIKKENINLNNIYIYILEEYRSNGYGGKLFKETLKILKTKNFKEIILDVNKNNYRMIEIINKNNCRELTNKDGVIRFLVIV